VRPTSDRVREAIFDVLGSLSAIEDAKVLDLFAGSGALGIEALSRGASSVTFVDSGRAAVATVRENLASTGLGDATRVEVVRSDAFAFLGSHPGTYEVAFLDPPYAFSDWEELLDALRARLCVIESSRPVELPAGYELHRSYRYGTTLLTVARRLDVGPDREP